MSSNSVFIACGGNSRGKNACALFLNICSEKMAVRQIFMIACAALWLPAVSVMTKQYDSIEEENLSVAINIAIRVIYWLIFTSTIANK